MVRKLHLLSFSSFAVALVICGISCSRPAGCQAGRPPLPDQYPVRSRRAAALLEIIVSERPIVGANGSFTFRIIVDSRFPETKQAVTPIVATFPYLHLVQGSPSTSADGLREWLYTAGATGEDVNLVTIRASICASDDCTGKLDKTRERVVDDGAVRFSMITCQKFTPRYFDCRKNRRRSFFTDVASKQGRVITPSSTIQNAPLR